MIFRLVGLPRSEHFDLILVELQSATGTVRVPLVDGWFEIQLALHRVPEGQDQREFFIALRSLAASLREMRPDTRWYFLHKPPGLKLRFRIDGTDAAALNTILTTVLDWRFPWLAGIGIGSVFDQAELMNAPYRRDVELLLMLAADEHLTAAAEQRYCSADNWAAFLILMLESLGLDQWLAYEALARLARLRSMQLSGPPPGELALLDPAGMLRRQLPEFSCGFEASVSLLQGLNMLFNIWGIDAVRQSHILDIACSSTRPLLLSGDK